MFVVVQRCSTHLQHLAGDVPLAVGAAHAEQALVVALAVGHAGAAHVLALQHGAALPAREAPRVPLPLQRHQRLPLAQLLPAARARCRTHTSFTFETSDATDIL